MKLADYEFKIEGEKIRFYHNQKTHRFSIIWDAGEMEVTKQRGLAIVEFLKKFRQTRS